MALDIAIDANRYSDFFRGDNKAIEVFASARRVILPFVVLGELRGGFRRGARPVENEQDLSRFLRKDRVSVLFADEGTTHAYAAVYAEMRRAGTPIPTNDLWIAALVMQHELVLFSRDQHFDRIPRLARC